MDQIYSLLMNGGLGVASFLALILLGKYILEDMKKSLDNNIKAIENVTSTLGDVTKTLTLMNQNLSNLSERVYKLENKGDE